MSHLLEKWLRILVSTLVNSRSLTTGGLYVSTKSHFCFIWWNYKPVISMFLSKSGIVNGLKEISSRTYNIRPALYLLQSHLKILKPFIWNYSSGKESLSLESEIYWNFQKIRQKIDICLKRDWHSHDLFFSVWIPQAFIFDTSMVIKLSNQINLRSLNNTYHLKIKKKTCSAA